MMSFLKMNSGASKGVRIPTLIIFFLILSNISLPAMGIPSGNIFNIDSRDDLFAEKYFMNIDHGSITLIARNKPLGPVLEEISRRSGIIITTTPLLRSKKISINWKGISIEDGLKGFADNAGLLLEEDETGGFHLSEVSAPGTSKRSVKKHEKEIPSCPVINTCQEEQAGISEDARIYSETVLSQNNDQEDNSVLNEMVIRFKQDISEQEIHIFLSGANIKVKRYIAALKYHILSLPEGMTYYDAMVLFKRKKMIYQAEPDYLIPVK